MNEISFPRDSKFLPMANSARIAGGPEQAEGRLPIISQYLRIAFRWRWLIAGSIVLSLLIGFVVTLLATPQYVATTRLEINREGSRIVKVEGVTPETTVADQEFYQTQYGLLRSVALAQRVARQLNLQNDRRFFEMLGSQKKFDEFAGPGGQQERLRLAGDLLLKRLAINPIRLSRLVDVSWTGPDPALAARIANSWAAAFVQFNLERRFDATSYARTFLEQRLGQLRQKLEDSERQLVTFASTQAIINIPVGGPDGNNKTAERSITADTLAALNEELARASADRIRAESRLNHSGGATVEGLTNLAIGNLRQKRAEAASTYSQLLTQFKPDYPGVEAAAMQVRQLDQAIAREEARVSQSLRNSYQDATRREQELQQRVEGLKKTFLDQRRRSINYNILQREVDTNRELYDGLLQRYKEIGIAGGVGENNVSVVDVAAIPQKPSQPRPALNLLLSLIVGTLLGLGLAVLKEQIDESITDPTDVEGRVGLPLLGAVPRSKSDNPMAEIQDPKSELVEAYHSVQTSLGFATDHGVPRTLAVTSTRPSEGKSTTAFALAYVLARNGSRVILCDGDMRSPSVHGSLGLGNDVGMSTFLSGGASLDKLIKHGEHGFDVLTAGPQPPNAAELLRSDRFGLLLNELLSLYDYVIIDSPPVMGLADTPLIASHTEGTVFVVEAKGVKARLARVALGRLQQGRAHLLGTVLTKFEARDAHLGYGYEYGYGYGYSAAEGKRR